MQYYYFYNNKNFTQIENLKFSVFSTYINARNKEYICLFILNTINTNELIKDKLVNYYHDVFNGFADITVLTENQIERTTPKLLYLQRLSTMKEKCMYLSNDTYIKKTPFINENEIYFLNNNTINTNYKVYEPFGLISEHYDDSVFYVPFNIAEDLLKDIDAFKNQYMFSDELIETILPYIIQTYAKIADIKINIMPNQYFRILSDQETLFLSGLV
jgi:hypothetical protein